MLTSNQAALHDINLNVYSQILEACRPFYALESPDEKSATDQSPRQHFRHHQNISPLLEDGLASSSGMNQNSSQQTEHAPVKKC